MFSARKSGWLNNSKPSMGDSGHSMSITTTADTLTAETTIAEVKKAIDAGGMS